MSKQLHYIISAFLLIVVFAGLIWLVKSIPPEHSTKTETQVIDFPFVQPKPMISDFAARGKAIFNSNCASCHNLFKDATGPKLTDVIGSEQWTDRKKLYAWIKNPAAFMRNDKYTQELRKAYGSMMSAFPDLPTQDIDAIVEYIKGARQVKDIPMPVAIR
ncbi:MAG TPA: cytochrome c [Chitinophagaceae bacterium]|nr:cytochrome c [Chitinophagaceae bacterium]